jgi:hypothetical protein
MFFAEAWRGVAVAFVLFAVSAIEVSYTRRIHSHIVARHFETIKRLCHQQIKRATKSGCSAYDTGCFLADVLGRVHTNRRASTINAK